MSREKTVLIIGGGVAALAAAVALIEANAKNNSTKFRVHIISQAHRWGGKASSWGGGQVGAHVNLTMWPEDFVLNHGFHVIFDENYYRNFWHTLRQAWSRSRNPPPRSLEDLLYSNKHEMLVHQKVDNRNVICRLQSKPGLLIPGSHLRCIMAELKGRGGWSQTEISSVGDVIFREMFRYPSFRRLLEIDHKIDPLSGQTYPNVGFKEWCRSRGLQERVIENSFFKFIYDASYVSPFEMEAAAALKTCWGVLRNYRSTNWYYVQGGYTQELFNPLHRYLHEHEEFSCTLLVELTRLMPLGNRIAGYDYREVDDHPDSSQPRRNPDPDVLAKYKNLRESGRLGQMIHELRDEFHCTEPPRSGRVDYFISTLPLENFFSILETSRMVEQFPGVQKLHNTARKDRKASIGTVNLQAWFQRRVTDPSLDNFIAGFEPLPVMVDYKNFLPMYRDDAHWPGSILEINGSMEELRRRYPVEVKDLLGDVESGLPKRGVQPISDQRIEFAKSILLDMAIEYDFPALQKAVENDAFLEVDDWKGRTRWKGRKVPPFLWWNVHEHNAYFVTHPGTLSLRPEITTPYDNLFLAGDWTRNGVDLPCMEGAARSGRMAVREILERENCAELIEVYDPV
jgi:uncharacterized protein with NAD-binding domain and iron-sulfur cluster